jgi:hypothetical protein
MANKSFTKQDVITSLVNGGMDSKTANECVDANFDYVMETYAEQYLTPRRVGKIITNLDVE